MKLRMLLELEIGPEDGRLLDELLKKPLPDRGDSATIGVLVRLFTKSVTGGPR